MKFTIRQILLATAFISIVLALVAVSIRLKNRTAELVALRASVTKPTRHHATAVLRFFRVDEVARSSLLPLATATEGKQVSRTTLSRSVPPEADKLFSVVARYIGSAQDGDVYEVIWNAGSRLPPFPSTHDFSTSSMFVKTGGGVTTLHESDQWKLEIVDDPAQSPNP